MSHVDLQAAVAAPVGCTCHPADEPPIPCPGKHALRDCRRAGLARKAALFQEGAKRLFDRDGDMWVFELFHFLGDVAAEKKD